MSYITWEYYSSLFADSKEEDFERLYKKAEMKLDAMTHYRAADFLKNYQKDAATSFESRVYEQIKNTLCELVHALGVQEATGMGDGVASASNDGYSESYKVTTAAEKEAQLYGIVRSGLSGTGMAGAL